MVAAIGELQWIPSDDFEVMISGKPGFEFLTKYIMN
jgi:hypothetical protein